MSTHKHIDKICLVAAILSILLCAFLVSGEALGIPAAAQAMGYETRLFDTAQVHTIDIVMEDWADFIETCESEEYAVCALTIDGEAYSNVGIRAKGNTSLSSVSSMGSDRYSFKIEFDQYDSAKNYYGLDKLSLNNVIQDATFMKDYLTYQLMGRFGVSAPLCSYVYITVNGEDWGLYLAVEGVEDAFLRRNYGTDHGELYKPDSMSFGGGRGNGKGFDITEFIESRQESVSAPESGDAAASSQRPSESKNRPDMAGGWGGMGSSDVKLQYIDDDPSSYSNIFDQAKTDISQADQARLIASLKTLSEGKGIESAVDVEQVLRYFVVHNFVVNGDSYTGSMIHNYYLYEENGKLSMIPWDYNLAFGTFQGRDATDAVNDPIDTPLSVTGSGDRPMIDWIFSDEEYTELYHRYFSEFLESTDFALLIDTTAQLIAPYVEKDPGKFCSYEDFESGVSALREFCLLRAQSVRGQLDGIIPSTASGQSAAPSALLDASHITLSDMGSMSMGGGMGNRFPGGDFAAQGNGNRGEKPQRNEGNDPTAAITPPSAESASQSESAMPMPNFTDFGNNGTAPQLPEGMTLPEEIALPENFSDSMFPAIDRDFSAESFPFDTAQTNMPAQNGTGLLWLAVSIAVLLAGLLVAKLYRR